MFCTLGMDQQVTASEGSRRNLFVEGHEGFFSRSMTEKRGSPLYDLKLDKLSKREKVNFDISLVLLHSIIILYTFHFPIQFQLHRIKILFMFKHVPCIIYFFKLFEKVCFFSCCPSFRE